MWCTCPNCDRGLGLRWRPSLSKSWQCRCGVTIQHNVNSFLEAWLRPAFLWSLLISGAVVGSLEFAGAWTVGHETATGLFGASLGVVFVVASGVALMLCPVGLLIAYCVGIPYLKSDAIRCAGLSIVAFGLAAAAIWMLIHYQAAHLVATSH